MLQRQYQRVSRAHGRAGHAATARPGTKVDAPPRFVPDHVGPGISQWRARASESVHARPVGARRCSSIRNVGPLFAQIAEENCESKAATPSMPTAATVWRFGPIWCRESPTGVELLQFGIYRGIGLEGWYHVLNAGFRFPVIAACDYPACRKLGDCRTYVAHRWRAQLRGLADGGRRRAQLHHQRAAFVPRSRWPPAG